MSEPIEVSVVGTPIARTAGSAHVINEKQLSRFERDDPHLVLASVPGVYARGEDGFGLRMNVGIRGVNPDRSKKVTLLEDGLLVGPAPYSAPAAYYTPLVTRMTQVRVIKGPAAISYGPQTVAGAIDFVTRPIPTETEFGADVAGGAYGYRKAHAHFGTSTEQFGFLIEGINLGSNGFKTLPNDGDTGFTRNEWMVKGRYILDPSAPTQNEFRIKLTYSDEDSNETYLGLSEADFADDPLQRYGASSLDRMTNHRTSVVASHILTLAEPVTLTTHLYRNDFARVWRKANQFRGASLFDVLTDSEDPVNQVYQDILRGEIDSSTPQESLLIGPNDRSFVSQGIETRLGWECDTGPLEHRMEYGLRFHNDRIERRHSQDAFVLIGGEPYPEGSPTQVTAYNEDESFALSTHVIDAITWRSLTVTPGLRFEAIHSTAADYLADTENTRWAFGVLPGIGGYYAITRDFGVLGGVYRGFSPPEPGSSDDVDPELSWNFEAGVRYKKGPAKAELIGFYNDYSNLTDVCTLSSGCVDQDLDTQFNAGAARIYGLEALIEHEPKLGRHLRLPLAAAYTLTNSEFLTTFESQDPIYGEVAAGDELPYVPRHQLGSSLGLEHERAGANVGLSYVAAMREEAGDESLEQALSTDAQVLLDLSLYFQIIKQLRLYAIGRNLLNQQVIVSHRPYGARPTAPMMFQLGVKAEL